MKLNIDFEKIKDFFIVNWIRFKNLVKEHKYISSVAFLLLVSCIVAIVVFAEDDDYKGYIKSTINSVTINKSNGLEENQVYSFDTVIFNLEYILENTKDDNIVDRDFEINAKICDAIDDEKDSWDSCSSSVDAFFDYGAVDHDKVNYSVSEDGKEVDVTSYINSTGKNNSHNQYIYLNTNNIKNGTNINILFRTKEITEDEYKYNKKVVTVISTDGNLSVKTVGASAYKKDGFDGRYVPYGILLGYEGSLKGKYFNFDNINLNLKAVQEQLGSVGQINLGKSNNDINKDFGVYKESMKILDIPDGKSDDSVYDSGEVNLEEKTNDSVVQNINEVESASLYLLGDKQVVLTKGETYDDPGVSLSKNGKKLNLDSNNITIYKGNDIVENIHNANDITDVGNYKVKYTYVKSSYEVSIYRNITIENKDSVSLDSKIYSLNGNKTVYITKGKKYIEQGILKDGKSINIENDSDVTVNVLEDDDISNKGGVITYTIISKVNSSDQKILKRTIKILEDDAVKFVDVKKLNKESINDCKTNSMCSIEYSDKSNNKINDISIVDQGTYDIIYKLSNEDFEVILKSKIIVSKEKYYELNIKNIKARNTNYKKDDFIVFGSYYVNALSTRESNNKEDIPVTLTVQYNENEYSNTINNYFESFGQKNLSINYYNDQDEMLDENSPIAYADEVILKSNFTYTIDGDYSLKDFKVKIPIDTNVFSLQAFSSEITDENIYYETSNDKATVKYYAIDNKEITKEDDKKNIAYIVYMIDKVNPGDEFDFSIRLKTKELTSRITLSGVECTYTENGKQPNDTLVKNVSPSLSINAFRASLDVEVDDVDNDTIVDGTKQSKIAIYPEVVMPSSILEVSKNLNLDSIIVTVTLPDKVSYVYNESYMKPKVNGKSLTYTYSGKKTNEELEPIYIDINYDIDTENSSLLVVNTKMNAKSGNINSNSEVNNNIIFENNEKVRASLNVSNKIVSKDKSFDITFNSFNASNENKTIGAIIVFPYNSDIESKKLFNGIYEVNIEDALCTTESSSKIVSNSNTIYSEDIWKNCKDYDSKDITAIKIENTVSAKNSFVKKVIINPKENGPGDEYKFSLYLYDSSKKISERNNSISVVTKMITGTIWEDFNTDGVMDDDENKVSGVSLKLYNEQNELVNEAISNDKGKYSLYDLQPGNYYIVAEFDTEKYSLIESQIGNSTFKNESEVIKTDIIEVTENTKSIENINLGLALRKVYNIKLSKYISKVALTNKLGISTVREFNNSSLVKIDIKDLVNTHIKVVYLIELENVGYYPGYVNNVIDYLPDGMTFNEEYEENKSWQVNESGYLENKSLSNEIMYSGDKKYLTIAFDISRKEAGSFVNLASVDEDDLEIYVLGEGNIEDGDENEENE